IHSAILLSGAKRQSASTGWLFFLNGSGVMNGRYRQNHPLVTLLVTIRRRILPTIALARVPCMLMAKFFVSPVKVISLISLALRRTFHVSESSAIRYHQ